MRNEWWKSPVALGSILAQIVLVAALFLTDGQVNAIKVIGGAVIVVIGVVTSANNPYNTNGFGIKQ